jgi:hypothetical protein
VLFSNTRHWHLFKADVARINAFFPGMQCLSFTFTSSKIQLQNLPRSSTPSQPELQLQAGPDSDLLRRPNFGQVGLRLTPLAQAAPHSVPLLELGLHFTWESF